MSGLLLNCGSGQRPFDKPWINCDIQSKWNPDAVVDCRNLSQNFAAGSAHMIVLHHVLEHFGCGEFATALYECHKVLEPGGSLLVFVPDMRELARRWLLKEMDDQLYFTNVYGAKLPDDEGSIHRWGYTLSSLSHALMEAAPWRTIKSFDWRAIPQASLARDWWIASAEAIK